jgi:hypothetical protein
LYLQQSKDRQLTTSIYSNGKTTAFNQTNLKPAFFKLVAILGNLEVGRGTWVVMNRTTVGMFDNFLLNVDPDFGRNLFFGGSDSCRSVSSRNVCIELTNR